jgi:hypothetical protein
VVDPRIIYCAECLHQPRKLPDACVDRLHLWRRLPAGELPTGEPNSHRNYEFFQAALSEPERQRAGLPRAFEDRHASTPAYIDYMRPRCVDLARVLKQSRSFYYHRDWHATHYVKVMLDQPGCSRFDAVCTMAQPRAQVPSLDYAFGNAQ